MSLALVLVSLVGCSRSSTQSVVEGRYEETPGTVHHLADMELWTVVPDADPGMRLCLDEAALPADVKVDGARVVFSGKRGDPPPNARMACNPLELAAIALAN